MTAKEFREFGFLQELNREYLHPLGLALEVQIDDEGNEHLGGIWDYREDPEGIIFDTNVIDPKKSARVSQLRNHKAEVRQEKLGFIIQEK